MASTSLLVSTTPLIGLERRLTDRLPVLGVSLVLDQPRLGGAARGYPYEPEAVERIARSPLARGFGLLPAVARNRLIHSVRRELSATAAFAGPHLPIVVGPRP